MEGTKMNKEIYYWESNMGALQDILNAGEDKAAIYYIGEAVKKAQVPMEDITSISVVDYTPEPKFLTGRKEQKLLSLKGFVELLVTLLDLSIDGMMQRRQRKGNELSI